MTEPGAVNESQRFESKLERKKRMRHKRILTESGKIEPVVTADVDLTRDASDKAHLSYVEKGWISKVTITYQHTDLSCSFNADPKAEISLQPVR